MTELRRDTGLMKGSRGRQRGHQTELREESGHRDRKRERGVGRKKRRKTVRVVVDGWGEWKTTRDEYPPSPCIRNCPTSSQNPLTENCQN